MTIKVRKDGTLQGATGIHDVVYALAAQAAKTKAGEVAALTDNSSGDATPTANAVQSVAAFVGAAASGSNLADKTTFEAALGKVKNAVTELAAKANAVAAKVGVAGVTDNSGGTAADGTIAACDQSVTGASTGSLVDDTNAIRVVINDAFAEITKVVNRCAVAVGETKVSASADFAAANGTIAAISTATGTAASPGVTKVEADAALVTWVDNIAFLVAKLNSIRAAGNTLVSAG